MPVFAFRAAQAGAGPVPQALGYLPWWIADGWRTIDWRVLDRVVLFDRLIEPDGALADRDWGRRAAGLAVEAERRGIPLELALTLHNEAVFEDLFADGAARARLLAAASAVLEERWIAGLHLDIEGYRPVQRAAAAGFREWLAALDEGCRARGKALSAFFPASDHFSPYQAVDAARMDYWVAQIYDAHWPDSKKTGPLVTRAPGNPVAVRRALARLAALGVPRARVLLSVPLYGWQWLAESELPGAPTRGRGKLLTYASTPEALMPEDRLAATELAARHGLRRDEEGTPYYAHHAGEQWVQGWFEDLQSLKAKLAPERGQGYGGLAFFPLGYDRGEIVEPLLRWWRLPR